MVAHSARVDWACDQNTQNATASAQNLSYDDILALDPSDSPHRAALKTAPATPAAPLPLPSRSSTASAASWGYDGETAPAHWHTLHTDYASCAGDR